MTQHTETPFEAVNHPAHYQRYPVECIVVAELCSFNIGSALTYLWRHGAKPGVDPIEDLEKAVWFIRREIQRLGAQPHDGP